MENRFEHQKLPAGPAHLHRISETPSQILAGSETKTHAVQTESDGTNAIGAREQRIVWIQPHELELNPNILRGDEPHHAKKKGSDRDGEGRSADLVDVGLERSGEEGRSHGGRPSGSFSKRSLRAGAESRRRVRGSCHPAETASCSFWVLRA
jgi:hypothetical protein